MTLWKLPLPRHALPFFLGAMLLVLATISTWRVIALRDEMHRQVHEQIEGQLTDLVEAWEDGVIDQLESWREAATTPAEPPGTLERRLRDRHPWFDALYVWLPERAATAGKQRVLLKSRFLWPVEPPSERLQAVPSAPCLAQATRRAAFSAPDPLVRIPAWVAGCDGQPLPVRLYAANQAADHLRRAPELDASTRARAALDLVNPAGLDPSTTLLSGIDDLRLDPATLVANRGMRGDILLALGEREAALDAFEVLAEQLTALDAPALVRAWQYLPGLRDRLRDGKRLDAVKRLDARRARSERRINAFTEIRDRIMPRMPSANASEGARFVRDQYAETPYLLYYAAPEAGGAGVALQVDQPMLIADLMANQRRFRGQLVVTDSEGRWVAGDRSEGDVGISVALPRTLSHLRVGLRQRAEDAVLSRLEAQWVVPILVVCVCVGAGLFAILAQVRAEREQGRMLTRQRDFTARVTHELKTPLAGIRLMAENLELGAYTDEVHRASMARAIVAEADRLGQRVDELLRVARAREVPKPTRFDPEEIVMEAVEAWAPRLDQVGILLHVDADLTEPVLGDAPSIRDALGCLLDNALKYRRDDRPDPQVWLTLRQEGKWVVFDVADNGLGVPKERRRDIFDRFVRIEGPHRGKAGGHGLGLSPVAEVAHAHGGSVECAEGIDGGARFVLKVPASAGVVA